MTKNEHEGHRGRMRQRFMMGGLDNFAPHEVLELLLFYAIPRRNVNPLAHQLIKRFGSLTAVLSASAELLREEPGITEAAITLITLMGPLARYMDKELLGERPFMRNLREAKSYCVHLFSGANEEQFYVICLDAQARVLRAVKVFSGTIDEITIYPREIVGTAIRYNAHDVVLAHNHPSGVLEPSEADIHTTVMLREALERVNIPLQDHIIYAEGNCLSLSQWEKTQAPHPAPYNTASRAADTKRTKKQKTSPNVEDVHE